MVLFAKIFLQKNSIVDTQPGYKYYCVKSVFIWSYSGPYFPACGLNMERYEISLRIQSKCVELRTRITINTNTFHAVYVYLLCFNIDKIQSLKFTLLFFYGTLFSTLKADFLTVNKYG